MNWGRGGGIPEKKKAAYMTYLNVNPGWRHAAGWILSFPIKSAYFK
jgi:hypothetical protein